LPALNETLLVEQARKGSQEAFAALVRAHQDAVYSLCHHMTGNALEAEDLAQESFLRFYRSLDRFRAGTPVRPWLHKIAVNACLDALRQRKGAPLSLEEWPEGTPPPRSPQGNTPEELCLHREARLAVQKALLRLPSDYRAVLVLRYLEGLSYQEVAAALDAPFPRLRRVSSAPRKCLAAFWPLCVWGERRRHELPLERAEQSHHGRRRPLGDHLPCPAPLACSVRRPVGL